MNREKCNRNQKKRELEEGRSNVRCSWKVEQDRTKLKKALGFLLYSGHWLPYFGHLQGNCGGEVGWGILGVGRKTRMQWVEK